MVGSLTKIELSILADIAGEKRLDGMSCPNCERLRSLGLLALNPYHQKIGEPYWVITPTGRAALTLGE
jgi:hypothetical protein